MIPLIFGISIPVISFVLILFNWRKNNFSTFLFAYYMVTGILGLVIHYNFSAPSPEGLSIFYLHFAPLFLVTGAFFFLYVQSKIENKNSLDNPWNYLHFLPAAIQFLLISKYYWMDKAEKIQYIQPILKNPMNIFFIEIPGVYFNRIDSFLARPILLFAYSLLSIYWLIQKKPFTEMQFNPREKTAKRKEFIFIWTLSIINCLFAIAMFFSFLYNYLHPESTNIHNSLFKLLKYSLTGITLIQIGSLLFSPNILYGYTPLEKLDPKIKDTAAISEDDLPQEIVEKSRELMLYIEKEKPYLDPRFSRSDLLIELQCSPKQLNEIFEHIIKQSFPEFKNTLRVNHAKKILSEGGADKLTMDGIGMNAGFPSRSSFYAIFKSLTGFTPVEYLEKIRRGDR